MTTPSDIKVGQHWRYKLSGGSNVDYEVLQDLGTDQWLVQRSPDKRHYIFDTVEFTSGMYNLLPDPLPTAAFPFWVNIFPESPGVSTHRTQPPAKRESWSGHDQRVGMLRIDIDAQGKPTITREEI